MLILNICSNCNFTSFNIASLLLHFNLCFSLQTLPFDIDNKNIAHQRASSRTSSKHKMSLDDFLNYDMYISKWMFGIRAYLGITTRSHMKIWLTKFLDNFEENIMRHNRKTLKCSRFERKSNAYYLLRILHLRTSNELC